jgi:hypothetical protein
MFYEKLNPLLDYLESVGAHSLLPTEAKEEAISAAVTAKVINL